MASGRSATGIMHSRPGFVPGNGHAAGGEGTMQPHPTCRQWRGDVATALGSRAMFDIPDLVRPFVGEIMDVDGHDAVPPKRWEEVYGREVEPLRQAMLNAANEGEAIIQ